MSSETVSDEAQTVHTDRAWWREVKPADIAKAIMLEVQCKDFGTADEATGNFTCSAAQIELLEKACNAAAERVCALLPKATASGVSEPVEWQRRHPTQGWQFVSKEDIPHYRSTGQEIRPLYAPPQPQPKAVTEDREPAFQFDNETGKTRVAKWWLEEMQSVIEAALKEA